MHIPTAAVLDLALRTMQQQQGRARRYVGQAVARRGDMRNLTLGSMADTVADEGASMAAAFSQVLELGGDNAASQQVTAAWADTARAITAAGLECRMAAMHTWLTASKEAA